MVLEIENFYGVYLLFSTNPKYKGQTYIGFTVNPNRRIKQHNKGRHAGGAKRTHGKGPWDMVLIVHGFPNMISALRFEWAWQKPTVSRRLRHLPKKRNNERKFAYCLRVMCGMLRTGPWHRLPLTVQWLMQEYVVEFDPMNLPPPHIPIQYGPVRSVKVNVKDTDGSIEAGNDEENCTRDRVCAICICAMKSGDNIMSCLFSPCTMVAHTRCLARHFLGRDTLNLLPLDGACPLCHKPVLWGDLVRYKYGCYHNVSEVNDADIIHWTDELQTQV